MTTPIAAADPTCRRCHGCGLDPDCGGHPTAAGRVWCECEQCDGDAAAVDDCRPGDDLSESAPDDATRLAFVASRYPTGRAA